MLNVSRGGQEIGGLFRAIEKLCRGIALAQRECDIDRIAWVFVVNDRKTQLEFRTR